MLRKSIAVDTGNYGAWNNHGEGYDGDDYDNDTQ